MLRISKTVVCLSIFTSLYACDDADDSTADDNTTSENASDAPAHPDSNVNANFETENLASERNIPIKEAKIRLDWQTRTPAFSESLEAALGDSFGGVWIDVNDNDRVKVAMRTTDASALSNSRSIIRSLAESHDLSDAADIIDVDYSYTQLVDANTWIANRIKALGPGGNLSNSLRTNFNAIQVSHPVDATLSDEEQDLIDAVSQKFGDLVMFDTFEGKFETQACTYPYCNAPLRGGVRIGNGSVGCTGAFMTQSKVDDKMYMFTAGHCLSGTSATWHTHLANGTAHEIGDTWNFQFGGSIDAGIIRIEDVSYWDPDNWVYVTASDDTSEDQDYYISSEGSSVIGMRICISGGYYGHSDCGTVTELGVTANYPGVTVTNMGLASYCSVSGDSGAPLYASHTSYGIHSGTRSSCNSLYQGIKGAENAMNVNVIH